MRNKKRDKESKINRAKGKFSLLLIIGIIVISMILLLVNAQYGGTLQSELDNLTLELTNQGYSWLINQTVNLKQIERRLKYDFPKKNWN